MNNLPYPVTTLTLSQEFHLKQLTDNLDKMSKQELIDMSKHLLKSDMILRANIAQLVKHSS